MIEIITTSSTASPGIQHEGEKSNTTVYWGLNFKKYNIGNACPCKHIQISMWRKQKFQNEK